MIRKLPKVKWIVLAGLFFLLGYFHQYVLSFIYQHAIQAYVLTNFGSRLNYDQAYLEGNRLIIQSPSLARDNDFKASQMALSWNFSLRNREIDISVELFKPSWKLDSTQTFTEEKLKKVFKGKKGGIKYLFDLTIHDGTVSWLLPDQTKHQLHFDVQTNTHSGGFIKAYFDHSPDHSHYISLNTESTPDMLSVTWDCHEIECSNLMPFAQLLLPSLNSLNIASGVLKGRIKTIFPNTQRPYIEGELLVENLSFLKDSFFSGQIDKAILKLEKNPAADQPITTLAKIDILEPMALCSYSEEGLEWKIDELRGSMALDGNKQANLQLDSRSHYLDRQGTLKLSGSVNLDARRDFNVDLHLCCTNSTENEGNVRLQIHPINTSQKKATVNLSRLSAIDAGLLQTILATFMPSAKSIEFQQGYFNAILEIILTKSGMQDLEIKQFEASGTSFKLNPIHAAGSFDQMQGKGVIHLMDPNPWDTLDVDFNLENGTLELEGLHQKLPLNAIQAHLVVKKGAIHQSLITLRWMGLKGVMDLEWGTAKELLTLNLEGYVRDAADFFPQKIQNGLHEEFDNTRLKILANFKRKNQQLELTGTLHVQRHQTDQFDLIHFGCDFNRKQKGKDYKWAPEGWFYAYDLPLEKFVTPFIFRKGVLKMWGNGEFKGNFNQKNFSLQYDVHNLKIENEHLLIEAKDLRSEIKGQMLGFHQMDLKNFSHQGILPIKDASYFEKKSGLHFSDINGTFIFKDQTLTIQPIETYCNGLFMAGEIFLDYSDPAPGVFNVDFNVPQLSGNITQIQQILAHLDNPSVLTQIPVEGDVNAVNQGMQLAFEFMPDDYRLNANIQASLEEGSLTFDDSDIAFKGLYLDILYDHDQKCLAFTDIQGTLLVGKPSRVEEYFFGGNHIRLKDLNKQNIDLDVWIKDHNHELFRLNGSANEINPGIKEISLASNSHLSCIYPSSFTCQLQNWSEVNSFQLKSQFDLGKLREDLLLFRNTGLYGLSHSFLDKVSQAGALDGQIKLDVFFDTEKQSYCFQADGNVLKGNPPEPHRCVLQAHKLEKKWIIDHLQWDKITAHAEIQPEHDHIRIPFLGLNDGNSLLLGLEGDLFLEEGYMRSKVHLFEYSLENLNQWPSFQDFVVKWQPEGKIRGSGEMKIDFLSQEPWFKLDSRMQLEMPQFSCRQCPFFSLQPFRMHYKTNECISLDNVQMNLCHDKDCSGHLKIAKLVYRSNENQLVCPQLAFQIPTQRLQTIGSTLHRFFPDLIDAELKDLFIQLKSDGELKGTLGFEKDPANHQFHLKLDEGIYSYNQQEYELKKIEINQAKNQLQLSAITKEERCPYQIIAAMKWPSMESGEATLIDLYSNPAAAIPPLKIQFSKDPSKGFLIHSMQGYFCGMNINLNGGVHDNLKPEISNLQGKIEAEFNQISPLLTPPVAENIRNLELGSTYILQGDFGYNCQPLKELTDRLYFKGQLFSQEAVLKGFQIQNLKADINYRPKQMEISGLSLQDNAGSAHAERFFVQQNDITGAWWFSAPLLTVKNLKPAMLRDLSDPDQNTSARFKTLLIKRLDFENLKGNLGDIQTWQAKGSMHFLNPTRKNTNPLFAIPAEIILRLGLNPQVLNPVTGTISFDMQGDHFYLTKFKDVYSEGRGSKFYLADSANPSWMDMKGNLNVQIKMKQYNLLFKLAELFTVSVEGNIKKPKFYLQKYTPTKRGQKAPFFIKQ